MAMTDIVLAPGPELVVSQPRVDATRNPALVYLGSLTTQKSRETMRYALLRAVRMFRPATRCDMDDILTFPWHTIRYEHMEMLRSKLAEEAGSYRYGNLTLGAVKQVLKRCQRFGLMDANECMSACSVKNITGHRLPAGRALEPTEVTELMDACEPRAIGARDLALIAILYGTGLRRSEAASLLYEQYDRQAGTVRIVGKGNKERLVHVNAQLRGRIDDWLALRGHDDGPLLRCVRKNGAITATGMSLSTITAVLRKLMARVNAATDGPARHVSPHDFRRTFLTLLLESGADVLVAKELAGHASVNTTAVYVRRGEKAKKAAVELLPKV
jgi:integrase/recombinase XerD